MDRVALIFERDTFLCALCVMSVGHTGPVTMKMKIIQVESPHENLHTSAESINKV